MIELVFLAVMNRLMSWGLAPIIATRRVAADLPALHRLLSDAASQCRLASGFVDGAALRHADAGCDARVHLALGARGRASVLVRPSATGRVITSELRIGRRGVAWLTWILSPDRGTTEVDLALQLESRSLGARLFLLLGGRRRIARRLDAALAALATASAHVAEHPADRAIERAYHNGSRLAGVTTD